MSVSYAPQHHFFFQRYRVAETPLFLLEIFDSANSGFLNFSRSLGFYFFKRGRRQLPQAGEVRRPRGRGVVSLWVEHVSFAVFSTREGAGG